MLNVVIWEEREPQGWSASLFYLTQKILIENNKKLHMHETFWGCTLSKKMLLSFALGHFPPNLWPLSMMYLLCTWNQENVATNQWKILQLTSALNLANQPPICGRHFCSHWKRLHSAWKWTDLLFRFEDHNYLNLFKLLWIVFQS